MQQLPASALQDASNLPTDNELSATDSNGKMRPASVLAPALTCWEHEKELPGGGTSLHEVPGAAGTAAGLEHLPQVAWQKLPSSMKAALHLPNAFCMKLHLVSELRHVCRNCHMIIM